MPTPLPCAIGASGRITPHKRRCVYRWLEVAPLPSEDVLGRYYRRPRRSNVENRWQPLANELVRSPWVCSAPLKTGHPGPDFVGHFQSSHKPPEECGPAVLDAAVVLALNTTMRANELKGLQWRDVNLLDRTVTVRHSKMEAGERVIPLNADAFAAILAQDHRAGAFAGVAADHDAFPACENGRTDPTRPQRSCCAAWRRIRPKAGLPNLRFHDLRHHTIAELAESRASFQTNMAIAGHVSPKMLAHYSYMRLDANRQAVEAIASRPAEPVSESKAEGYVTKKVANEGSGAELSPQPTENMVDLRGFEPLTPWLQTRCSPS
jgi:integrase